MRNPSRILPLDEDIPQYCVQGQGFSGGYHCLDEAIKVIQVHKNGAVYERLWSYEGFAQYPGLLNEVRCYCEDCAKRKRDE